MDDATAGAIEITKAMLVGIGKGQPDITANGDRSRAGGRGCRSSCTLSQEPHHIPADALAHGDQVVATQQVVLEPIVSVGLAITRWPTMFSAGRPQPPRSDTHRSGNAG